MLYNMKSSIAQEHSRYITSGTWKCGKSPNGAHHWIIDDDGRGVCRHCDKDKIHPMHINGIN